MSTSTAPYATLTFTDVGPQTVRLVIRSSLETAGESFFNMDFNGLFGSNSNRVIFDAGTVTNGSFTLPTVGNGENDRTIPNPNGFDFSITFDNAGMSASSAIRFDGSDELTYIITCQNNTAGQAVCGPAGANPLDATDFVALSADGLLAAGRLATFNTTTGADIDNQGARYVAVPEPASVALFAIALAGFGVMRVPRSGKILGDRPIA